MLEGRTLQNCRKLLKDYITVLSVFDGKLAFPNCRVEIDEHLTFLLSLCHENLYCGPASAWVGIEAASWGLRKIVADVHERERKRWYSQNFGRLCPCLKGPLEIGQENSSV